MTRFGSVISGLPTLDALRNQPPAHRVIMDAKPFDWTNADGSVSTCCLRVVQMTAGALLMLYIAIATESDDNGGITVTEGISALAEAIGKKFGLSKSHFTLVERYDSPLGEFVRRVVFNTKARGFAMPAWVDMTPGELRERIGEEVRR